MATDRAFNSLVGLVGLLAVNACAAPTTADCSNHEGPSGRYAYVATQDSPAQLVIEGVLVLDSGDCSGFTGGFDVVEQDPQGSARRVTASIVGRTVGSTGLRFDVEVAPTMRQHIGSTKGDSITGTWIAVGGGGAASGTFRGRRIGNP